MIYMERDRNYTCTPLRDHMLPTGGTEWVAAIEAEADKLAKISFTLGSELTFPSWSEAACSCTV